MKTLILSLLLMASPQYKPVELNPFELFTVTYLPHTLQERVPAFHREWYAAAYDNTIRFLEIESARLSAKSQIFSVNYPVYLACEGDDPEIQTFSESGGVSGMSTKWMSRIKKELTENQLLVADYGIKPGNTWTQDHIQIVRPNGFTVDIFCRGKHAAVRGSRGVVIIDDPQNSDDVRSETVLARDEDWLFSDVLPVLKKDQRLILIGTPISPLSLISKCKSIPEFTVKSFPAEDPPWSGKSRWPEQWPDSYLAERLSIMGRDRYGAEYLCEPRVPGNPVFRPEWIRSYDPESETYRKAQRDFVYTVVGMDCAESKSDQADYTALVTLAVTRGDKPDYYVLDVRRGRWTTKQGAEQLFLVYHEYHQHKSVVESRVKPPYGDAMTEEIRARETIYSEYVNLYPVRPIHDKVTRAMHIQSMVQEGHLYINPKNPNHQILRDEMIMFTGDQLFHDDVLDALVMAATDAKARTNRGGTSGVKIESGLAGSWEA